MGYIYIRVHPSYDEFNCCKLGKTDNIPRRDSQYVTGEIKRGYFISVFEIFEENVNVDDIERLLQIKFKKSHVKYNAGNEFYKKNIINDIDPYLHKLNIKYKKLTQNEIDMLVRVNNNNNDNDNDNDDDDDDDDDDDNDDDDDHHDDVDDDNDNNNDDDDDDDNDDDDENDNDENDNDNDENDNNDDDNDDYNDNDDDNNNDNDNKKKKENKLIIIRKKPNI
jgi:hypothetical protein